MSDTPFLHRIMKAVGALPGVRLFRQNVGMAWIGDWTRLRDGSVLIRNPRPLHAGLVKGSGDLIGWTSIEITPEMVGRRVAVFTSLEGKEGSGRANEAQRNWLQAVNDAGGIAGIVRSEEDARALIGRH